MLRVSVGEIETELVEWERSIADMAVPRGLTPFDTAAFTDGFTRHKAQIRLRMKALQTIKARVKTRCLNYAIQIERQLELQRNTRSFLDQVQTEVNNFFKTRSDDVYTKLMKAAQLVASCDPEDTSLLLTEVRRGLKAAADHFYPPLAEEVMCSDGKKRLLGDDQFLNRLHEFLAGRLPRSTSRDMLKGELDQLAVYVRRLNDVASKGVHGTVTLSEAKQGLVGLYFFLFNLIQHLTQDTNPLVDAAPTDVVAES